MTIASEILSILFIPFILSKNSTPLEHSESAVRESTGANGGRQRSIQIMKFHDVKRSGESDAQCNAVEITTTLAVQADIKPNTRGLHIETEICPVLGRVFRVEFVAIEHKSIRIWDRSIKVNDLRELNQRKSVSQFRREGPMKSRHIACDECPKRGIDNRIAGGIRRSNRVEPVDTFPKFIDLANNPQYCHREKKQ
ncbi:MAG: hypothetical protein NT069_13400 [Planctomycetota bacterium]|nr:hypothetical protein [Planctomycetota bacterium]